MAAEITEAEARYAGRVAGYTLIGTGDDARWFEGEPDTLKEFCGRDEATLRAEMARDCKGRSE